MWGGGVLQAAHAGRFRSSFVPSGTTGGDIGAKATIVAARVAPAQAVPPAPAAHDDAPGVRVRSIRPAPACPGRWCRQQRQRAGGASGYGRHCVLA